MIPLIPNFSQFELSPTLAANEQAAILRAAGKKVIHMGFGQSPFPVPQRLQKALKDNVIQKSYLATAGLEELREVTLDYYQRLAGYDPNDYDVLIAPGSKLILYALQMAIAGDLLMPVPAWVSYEPQSAMLGRKVSKVYARFVENGYVLTPQDMKDALKAARDNGQDPRKIILNYPSNPTGLSITHKNLEEIADICREEGIFIISDEIYGQVTYDAEYRSIASVAPDITAITTGLSKHLSLGGWRVGVGLIPKQVKGLFPLLNNIASETWSSVAAPIQYAAIEAFKGHADIEDHIKACTDIHYHLNQYVANSLRDLGLYVPPPQAAFYNYPDFAPFKAQLNAKGVYTSQDLTDRLLSDVGVLTLPGIAFGADPETLTLRVSANDYDGEAALEAYLSGQNLDMRFIEKYAPHIYEAPSRYKTFLFE